jgi:Flp pilus assembly protein TadD
LTLKPTFARVYNNRGIVLQDLGYLGEALASYERALELDMAASENPA